MKVRENLWVAGIIICVAILTRLIPHYPNFTALGAAALFGGAYLKRAYAIMIPIVVLFVSNIVLNNVIYRHEFPADYDGFVLFQAGSIWTYVVFVAVVLIGQRFIREGKVLPVIGSALGASLLFFAVSNFVVWLGSPIYPQTVAGLGMSYVAAIPFFWNTVAGDMFFCGVFFGGFEVARSLKPEWFRSLVPHTKS